MVRVPSRLVVVTVAAPEGSVIVAIRCPSASTTVRYLVVRPPGEESATSVPPGTVVRVSVCTRPSGSVSRVRRPWAS